MSTDTRLRAEGAIAALDVAGPRIKELEAALATVTAFHVAAQSGAEAFLAQTQFADSKAHSSVDIARLMEDYAQLRLTAAQDEALRLRVALHKAAQSLRTISKQAGVDEYMKDSVQIRGYANSRANVADDALTQRAPQEHTRRCDCHLYERQVCDICQGVTGRETAAPPTPGAAEKGDGL